MFKFTQSHYLQYLLFNLENSDTTIFIIKSSRKPEIYFTDEFVIYILFFKVTE